MIRVLPLILAPACLLASLQALAQQVVVVEIPATEDNTIWSPIDDPDREEGVPVDIAALSNGAGDYLFVGNNGPSGGNRDMRTLIRFGDLSAIPEDAAILNVELVFDQTTRFNRLQGVTAHRMLAPWGEGAADALRGEGGGIQAEEGDATWEAAFFSFTEGQSTPWTTPGGDFEQLPSEVLTVQQGDDFITLQSGLGQDLRFWLRNPDLNYGWMVRSTGEQVTLGFPILSRANTAFRFASRTNPNQTRDEGSQLPLEFPPVLRVTYATPNEIGGGISGLWFDPSRDGDGFVITRGVDPSAGEEAEPLLDFAYFGYFNLPRADTTPDDVTDDDLEIGPQWLVTATPLIGTVNAGAEVSLTMLRSTVNRRFVDVDDGMGGTVPQLLIDSGTFANPTPGSDLELWGVLRITFESCTSATATLAGVDGVRSFNLVPLVPVNAPCSDDPL